MMDGKSMLRGVRSGGGHSHHGHKHGSGGEGMAAEVARRPELPDPDSPPLKPDDVKLFYDPHGFLRATVGVRTYLDISIVRAFPLSLENHYYGLLSGRLDEIGIIQDPSELDDESRKVIASEIERRYFSTIINRIVSIREEFGATYWEVETDRGQRSFVGKHLRDNVSFLSDVRILIQDVDHNRYEINDLSAIDEASRSMLLRII
jgi:hypothetical protein